MHNNKHPADCCPEADVLRRKACAESLLCDYFSDISFQLSTHEEYAKRLFMHRGSNAVPLLMTGEVIRRFKARPSSCVVEGCTAVRFVHSTAHSPRIRLPAFGGPCHEVKPVYSLRSLPAYVQGQAWLRVVLSKNHRESRNKALRLWRRRDVQLGRTVESV